MASPPASVQSLVCVRGGESGGLAHLAVLAADLRIPSRPGVASKVAMSKPIIAPPERLTPAWPGGNRTSGRPLHYDPFRPS